MDRTVIAIFIAIGKSLFCIAFLKPSIRPYWWMSIPIHPLNYAYAKVGHFRCQRVIKCSAIDLHGWMVGPVINLPMRWIHWNLIVSKCNNVQRTLLYVCCDCEFIFSAITAFADSHTTHRIQWKAHTLWRFRVAYACIMQCMALWSKHWASTLMPIRRPSFMLRHRRD